jgi:membrane-anchored glycerophosphoryl diester phosphodiesterase (GDPDase)
MQKIKIHTINKINKILKLIRLNNLALSSLIFITNIITTFLYKNYIYSFFFIILTITSISYHSNKNIYTNISDKIAILLIVLYGSYKLYREVLNLRTHASEKMTNFGILQYIKYHPDKIINIIIVCIVCILFVLTNILYIYGYFHNQISIGNKYHSLIHLISSIAHHLIIIMR